MATKSRTYGRGILRFNSWETCRRPGQLQNSNDARKREESAANGSQNHAQNGGVKSTNLNETTGSSEKNSVGKLDISRKIFFILYHRHSLIWYIDGLISMGSLCQILQEHQAPPIQIFDIEIAAKIRSKFFNMYLCNTYIVKSYTFLMKKAGPCCSCHPATVVINSKEILLNNDKRINMQLLKREKKRLGLDCMPYTEPLRWILQEPTWAQKWSHQGNQYIPIVSLRKTLRGNIPRWFF